MAEATLGVAAVLSATGWTGATVANLNASDNARATGGTVNESITVDLEDVPQDWVAANGDIVLEAEAVTSGNATRAKRLRLELLDSQNNVLGTGETTNLSTTESVVGVTVSGRTDDQTAANGWKLRATVLESGGKGDSVTVSIDQLRVRAAYDNSVPARTGSGLAALTLGGAASGVVTVTGSGGATLALGAAGAGAVAVSGSGTAALTLGATAQGSHPSVDPRLGQALAALALGGGGAGQVSVGGGGVAALALGGSGRGWAPIRGTGIAVLALGGTAAGTNEAEAPESPPPASNGKARGHCRAFHVSPLGASPMDATPD